MESKTKRLKESLDLHRLQRKPPQQRKRKKIFTPSSLTNNLWGKHLMPTSPLILQITSYMSNHYVTIALQLLHQHKRATLETIVGLDLVKRKPNLIPFQFFTRNCCLGCHKTSSLPEYWWSHINLHTQSSMTPIVGVTIIVELKVIP